MSIKALRKQSGLTQAELARMVGISVRALQNYENGNKKITSIKLSTACNMAIALNCKLIDLLDRGADKCKLKQVIGAYKKDV